MRKPRAFPVAVAAAISRASATSTTSCSTFAKCGVSAVRSSTWTCPSVTTESCCATAPGPVASASRFHPPGIPLLLELLVDAHDPRRAAGRLVDVDHRAGEADVALGHLELPRRVHQKAVQRLVGTEADHRVVRAGHADVGLERRAVREDALVR